MLRINQATYLSLLVGFILAVRLSNSLWRSDILLFLEFIDIVSILFCNFTEFITFLCTFLVSFLFCFVVVVVVVLFFFYTKIIWFYQFHLVGFQVCYLLLPVQELLVNFEEFVLELIYWDLFHVLNPMQLHVPSWNNHY